MTQLKWLEDAEGFVSGEHHIRRIGDASRYRWRLDTRGHTARAQSGIATTTYASLRDAKAAADRADRDSLLRDTVVGHAVLGVAALVVLTALLPTVGNLMTFVAAMFLFYVGLRSLTFSISLKLGDAWGWTRDGGTTQPPRLSDRVVRAGIAWIRRTSTVAIDTEPEANVRVLPPGPPA